MLRMKEKGRRTHILGLLVLLSSLVNGLQVEVVIKSHVTCYGGSNGVAFVNITDAVEPIKIMWPASGDSGATATGLPAGVHNVTIKDANSVIIKDFVMLQPSRIEGDVYGYSSAASCDKLGTVSAMAHGGTPPYIYAWEDESGDEDIAVLTTASATIIFDEVLTSNFVLSDGSNNVNMKSGSVEAYSGIWSLRVSSPAAFKFSILCAPEFPVCIQSNLYRGIQLWMYKSTSSGKFSAGLLDSNGIIEPNGITEFSFTEGTWSPGFLDFSSIPDGKYSGIYFVTHGAYDFHLDDIVLLPFADNFVRANTTVGYLEIGTPSAIYAPAGAYSVRIEDSNQCSAVVSLSIDEVPELENEISIHNVSVIVLTNGGTPPYQYNITGPLNESLSSSDGMFANLPVGNYTIDIMDSRTCKGRLYAEVSGSKPPIPPPLPPDNFSNYKVINAFLGILAGVFAFFTILLSVLVHKRKADLRPHSLLFCQTILIGSLLGYIAAILAVLDVSWTRSIAFSWTVDSSVTIIYGSMFAKSMQILKILDNFTKFVSIDTTDRYMAKVFCFIIVPELILLVIWTSLTGTVLQQKYSAGEGEVIFWNVFLVYKGIVGFVASFVCFRMRYKFKEYLEIQQIAYCHFTLEILLVFLLVFTMIAREKYSELFVAVQSLAVFVIVTIPLLVIISPILGRAIKDWREEKRTKKWHNLTMYS